MNEVANDAFEDGVAAREAGLGWESCPYSSFKEHEETEKYKDWLCGWHAADEAINPVNLDDDD